MISRYEATLNNITLSGISQKILILDIQYGDYTFNDTTFQIAKRQGVRLHSRNIPESTVTISFAIREYNIATRQSICADIVKWARNGGTLKTNDRTGQHLRVALKKPPVITSAMRWTDTLQIVFAAYALPFWEADTYQTVSSYMSSASFRLFVNGNVNDAPVSVICTARAAITTVSFTVNGRTMTLSGLSLASGDKIEIGYDENMIQYIKVGNTSLLDKRSGVDDLLVNCGEYNTLAYTADGNVSCEFRVWGLWM